MFDDFRYEPDDPCVKGIRDRIEALREKAAGEAEKPPVPAPGSSSPKEDLAAYRAIVEEESKRPIGPRPPRVAILVNREHYPEMFAALSRHCDVEPMGKGT